MKDPLVKTGTADDEDYLHSGYDRGHLAPAADLGYSLSSMAESFYYSNMSPQVAAFNRGVWKRLEGQVRVWARNNGAVYVVTGPVLRPGLPSIGANKVSVPELYYKVILDYRMPEYKALGFVLPNAGSKLPLTEFAVSIDSVERLTGIDFFPALPDKDENTLESNICLPCWKWSTSSPSGGKKPTPAAGEAVQCGAATKAGDRCKRMTKSPNGNCWQHGGD
jgi:endonuclease G